MERNDNYKINDGDWKWFGRRWIETGYDGTEEVVITLSRRYANTTFGKDQTITLKGDSADFKDEGLKNLKEASIELLLSEKELAIRSFDEKQFEGFTYTLVEDKEELYSKRINLENM